MDGNVVVEKNISPEAAPEGGLNPEEASPSPSLRGRAAYLAKYRERNPDAADDTADDALYDDALGQLAESEGRYGELAGSNRRLAELVSKDPKLAAVLTMIAGDNPRSLPGAIAKVYGKDFLELDETGLADFESGYREHLQGLAHDREALEEANRNIAAYQGTLDKFGKANRLSEADLDGLGEAVGKFAVDILKGNISEAFIDFIWKGLNYDRDVEDAAAAGEAEGKSSVVKPQLKKMAEVAPVGGGAPTFGEKKPVAGSSMLSGKSHWDNLRDV